ncbi:MAG TPA: HlyD family type I secretion periplasmic adaptor subunit [Caulobacteraceae bacterium]|nr:HlyD family type I secretion periplasmic adaptor subunit [Caulobacteraceae bacterium]
MDARTTDKVPAAAPRPWGGALLGGGVSGATLTASPRRDITAGLIVLGIFLLVFVGWGLLANLDAGVFAPGQVVVYGNRQAVQHRDGGIVSELDVHEGDRVQAGQVLLRLSADELQANERATAGQVFALEALQARLMAEMNGRATIARPDDFAKLTGPDLVVADNAMQIQQHEFTSRAAELSTQKAVLQQRENQLADEISGYREQLSANRQQQSLVQQEQDGLKDLLARGLVPMTRERSLERDAAQLSGSGGEYTSDIARTEQQIGETRLQVVDLDRQRIADDSKDYRDADESLTQAKPKLVALDEQLERLTVRAPASGQVVGLTIFTVGGVVAPGQKLMDVVPTDQPLVIEARVKPDDAGELRVGQSTEIRIPAFRDRRMPLLMGTVRKISADALVDDKSGQPYFKIEVEVPPSQLAIIHQIRGAEPGLIPGLPVEVVVPLKHRSALDYLIEPLKEMLWKSFRQR